MAHKQRHPNYTHTFIDSCAFDPADKEQENCSRRLLERSKKGEIVIEIADSVQNEIKHPNTPQEVKVLARELIYTIKNELTSELQKFQDEIQSLVRGNAKKDSHKNDADHIFDLYKFGGGYFVTTDNRLLSLRDKLFKEYFVTTIKPCEYEALL